MTLQNTASNFLEFFHKRRALRIGIAALIIFFMANLDALVDSLRHPEIPYFEKEHLIVGGVTAIATTFFFFLLAIYLGSLERALREVKTLKGLLPICSSCNKIRDTEDRWQVIEKYIADRTDARFTHSLCPDCARKLYGDMVDQFGRM